MFVNFYPHRKSLQIKSTAKSTLKAIICCMLISGTIPYRLRLLANTAGSVLNIAIVGIIKDPFLKTRDCSNS